MIIIWLSDQTVRIDDGGLLHTPITKYTPQSDHYYYCYCYNHYHYCHDYHLITISALMAAEIQAASSDIIWLLLGVPCVIIALIIIIFIHYHHCYFFPSPLSATFAILGESKVVH